MAVTPKKQANNFQPDSTSERFQSLGRGPLQSTLGAFLFGTILSGMAVTTGISAEGDNASSSERSLKHSDQEKTTRPPIDLSGLSRQALQKRVQVLSESLAQANKRAKKFQRRYEELRERDEALGITLLTDGQRELQDRVLLAVKEAYLLEMKRRDLSDAMQLLLEASREIISAAENLDPVLFANYEGAARAARGALEGEGTQPIPIPAMLTEGQIAHVNAALSLVVINLGSRQGLREGAPMIVQRSDTPIARLKVVAVYELASAALIEDKRENAQLIPGDRVLPDTD